MFERWITRKHDRVRLTSSPLCSHLLSFAERMEADGYTPRTLRRYLFAGEAFGRWLVQQGCPIEHVDEPRLRLHVASVGRQRLKGRARGRLPVAASGVRKLVEESGRNARRTAVMPGRITVEHAGSRWTGDRRAGCRALPRHRLRLSRSRACPRPRGTPACFCARVVAPERGPELTAYPINSRRKCLEPGAWQTGARFGSREHA